ncbi:hypothetical protein [Hymenobacter cellulosilyticus]|uniref:Uncharacterized protein n=1 Tax=Hymenobacter cellulosilyticus TaxID=2932248 RepID=A0A8T9Q506_9BACT|nr:hypothetical protein [Hymenobacter cellulosilyticus]UOQ70978.1 hypothetical protein MUN79_20205 [Hymenobacter cellulosilyticus]
MEILPDLPPTGRLRLQDLLLNWPLKDFVKGVVGLFGLTQQTDPYTRVVSFTPTGPALAASLAMAPDWQPRLDASEPTIRLFHLPGVVQRNDYRYKEDSANPDSAQGLGDDFLLCPDTTLERSQEALTLPWAATAVGTSGLLLLPVYKLRLGAASVEPQYDKQSPVPRLVIHEQVRTVTVTDGTARANISPRVSTFAGLSFAFATDLLPAYYAHLRAVYARPLILKPAVRLSAQQVMDFNQLVPV